MMARWTKYELIALDGVGYVPLADSGVEFLFQVISDRAERAALILTTTLPFPEWTTVFPNPRLCKALLDRITDRAHIIGTGTGPFRFRRTMDGRGRDEGRAVGWPRRPFRHSGLALRAGPLEIGHFPALSLISSSREKDN